MIHFAGKYRLCYQLSCIHLQISDLFRLRYFIITPPYLAFLVIVPIPYARK